jgi:hypothetical protein
MRRTLLQLALLAVAAAPGLAAGSGAEITVFGSQISGDYGAEVSSDRQTAAARVVFGERTQVKLDLGFLRVNRQSLGVTETPFGPITVGPGRKGPQGGQGGSGGGNGSGSGGGLGFEPAALGAQAAATTAEPSETALVDEWVTGISDLKATISHRLLGGGLKIYRLDAELGLKAPLADEQEYLGTGEWDYRVGMSGQYRFWSTTAFAGLGWNSLGDPSWVELDDVVDGWVGLESEPLGEKLILSGWLEGNQEVIAGNGSRTALGVGVRTLGTLRWQAQATIGLGGAAEDFSALVGASFGVARPAVGKRGIR